MHNETDPIDDRITIRQAVRLIPGRPHFSTVWRWARHGVAVNGGRVRLRTWQVGSKLFTSPAAIDEFIAAATTAGEAAYAAHAGEGSPQRRAAIEAAERRCDKAGVTAA